MYKTKGLAEYKKASGFEVVKDGVYNKVEIQNKGDHIYINTVLYNSNTGFIYADFNQPFSKSIINIPYNWHLAIARFTIPLTSVPIFFWGADGNGNARFSVTLSVGSDNYQTFLTYVAIDTNTDSTTQAVFYYQQMVDYINTALSTSWTALKAAHGGVASTTTPYMTYNPDSQNFTLFAQQTFVSDSITIWFNTNLYSLFENFQAYFAGTNQTAGKDFNIYVKNQYNNVTAVNSSVPAGYYGMEQEYSNLHLWNELQNVSILTSSIPVIPEFIPDASTNTSNSNATDSTRPIMTDFEPINSNQAGTFREVLQYQPNVFKWTDLRGDSPLNNIDYQVQWGNNQGVYRKLKIYHGDSLTMKFLFKDKDSKTLN